MPHQKFSELAMFFRLGRLFRAVGRDILVLWYACRNPATPLRLKLLAMVLAFYVLSPIDLIPDWLAVLGLVDDVTLLAFGLPFVLKWVPETVLLQARGAADAFLSRMRFGKF